MRAKSKEHMNATVIHHCQNPLGLCANQNWHGWHVTDILSYMYGGTEFTVISAYCYSHDLLNCDALSVGKGMNSSNETTASLFRKVAFLL